MRWDAGMMGVRMCWGRALESVSQPGERNESEGTTAYCFSF